MRASVRLLVASAALAATTLAYAGKKPEADGDAGESKAQMALKNRAAAPKDADIDPKATLAALLDQHDANAWSNSKAATVQGTLVQVEREADGDLHVVLAPHGQETDTKRWVIVEVPSATQRKHAELSLAALRKLQGKNVSATGWLYYEPDTEPNDPRGTLWELHPATRIVAD